MIAWNGAVQQFNATLGDLLLRLRQPVPGGAAGDIVLVAIDDRTAARYGPLPLPRPLLAESLRRIAVLEPKVLAIDLLLAEPTPHDGELARALQLFPGVVLSSALESDPGAAGRWIMPLPALRAPGTVVGHVHASPDADGVVRSILLSKVAEKRRYWALGLETARLALGAGRPVESKEFLQLGPVRLPAPERDQRRLIINYAGPEGVYRRISLGSVLEGGVSRDTIRGKIVIVGRDRSGRGGPSVCATFDGNRDERDRDSRKRHAHHPGPGVPGPHELAGGDPGVYGARGDMRAGHQRLARCSAIPSAGACRGDGTGGKRPELSAAAASGRWDRFWPCSWSRAASPGLVSTRQSPSPSGNRNANAATMLFVSRRSLTRSRLR